MWEFMIRIVSAAEIRIIVGWFVASAVLRGVTLALMIPFLRALYTHPESLTGQLVAVVTLGVVTFVADVIVMPRSYRVSVFETYDTMVDRVAEHVLALLLGWFNTEREAAVVNAVSKEASVLSHLCSMVIPNLCSVFIVPLMMLMAVEIIEWLLALIMAVAIVSPYLV